MKCADRVIHELVYQNTQTDVRIWRLSRNIAFFLRLLISQDEYLREMSLSLLPCVFCLGNYRFVKSTGWYIQNRRLINVTSNFCTKSQFSHNDTFRICVLSCEIAMTISHYETQIQKVYIVDYTIYMFCI